MPPQFKVTVTVQPSAVVLATLFSAAVGIFFGLYSAIRAARLSPIEALRYQRRLDEHQHFVLGLGQFSCYDESS